MKQIELTRGLIALVDDEDFEALNAFLWYAHSKGKTGGYYAARTDRGSNHKILMHREILKPDAPDIKVDHRNGDSLDNRRCNLRLATQEQNRANTRSTTSASGFKGVYPLGKRFKAVVAGKTIGYCNSAEEAARVYDAAALAKWGEFAATNLQLGLLK